MKITCVLSLSLIHIFRPEIEAWLKEVGSYYGHLTTARFTQIGLAEFETQSAVDYFTKKKTEFIGDFTENIAKTETYLARLKGDLEKLAALIQSDNALNGKLSLEDIIVFPVLRNLTCVKGIEFPPAVLAYITNCLLYTSWHRRVYHRQIADSLRCCQGRYQTCRS